MRNWNKKQHLPFQCPERMLGADRILSAEARYRKGRCGTGIKTASAREYPDGVTDEELCVRNSI